MKKIYNLFALVFCFQLAFAQDFPTKPNQLVNDYTGTLSEEQTQQLENKLVALNDSTSNQIAVVLIKSVGDYDINEYALELGRRWGLGGKDKNNGVVLLVAIGDRKLSIQTGYGLEGALPDVYTKRIIEDDIKPSFKEGQYYAGIDAGINAIIKLIKGEYKANPKAQKEQTGKTGSIIAIIIIIIVIIVILNRKGGGGGGNQIIGGRGTENALFWAMLLGSGRSGGGGWGSGGGSSGGGFGGFGGGSFGGGGSSGSW